MSVYVLPQKKSQQTASVSALIKLPRCLETIYSFSPIQALKHLHTFRVLKVGFGYS